ncbi:MAG: hypothetical protein NXI16_16540 [Alphaproteobacteria bacterium]|nr:hypothetical protein [Alphaproteobacteria bacterium]
MRRAWMVGAVALGTTLFAPDGHAREDNFNEGAYDSASQTGINNANCNSALILVCPESGGSASFGAPSPGLAAAGAVLLGGVVYAMRRRRRG